MIVGSSDTVGVAVGLDVGSTVGLEVVGIEVGDDDGTSVGVFVGADDG